MKVSELIELLDECDPDKEIYLATQPNYPIAYKLGGLYDPENAEPWDEDSPSAESMDTSRVWLLEGTQANDPYSVPRDAWEG